MIDDDCAMHSVKAGSMIESFHKRKILLMGDNSRLIDNLRISKILDGSLFGCMRDSH